jgi:hypothetical protein
MANTNEENIEKNYYIERRVCEREGEQLLATLDDSLEPQK